MGMGRRVAVDMDCFLTSHCWHLCGVSFNQGSWKSLLVQKDFWDFSSVSNWTWVQQSFQSLPQMNVNRAMSFSGSLVALQNHMVSPLLLTGSVVSGCLYKCVLCCWNRETLGWDWMKIGNMLVTLNTHFLISFLQNRIVTFMATQSILLLTIFVGDESSNNRRDIKKELVLH